MTSTQSICRWSARLVLAGFLVAMTPSLVSAQDQSPSGIQGVGHDFKLFVTAPLRWDGEDWVFLGSSIAAVGIAHHYDADARSHFVASDSSLATIRDTHDLADAAPGAAAVLGTWAFAAMMGDTHGKHEAWSMAEATALGVTTSFVLKFAAGRERPNETQEPNNWRAGGDSFPSLHTTAAFAIGTVLAESGNDDYRWVRRTLGYGLGAATGYLRVKHNAHWLSDTVAGAAIGIATARFVLNRDLARQQHANIWVTPTDGGLSIAYTTAVR